LAGVGRKLRIASRYTLTMASDKPCKGIANFSHKGTIKTPKHKQLKESETVEVFGEMKL